MEGFPVYVGTFMLPGRPAFEAHVVDEAAAKALRDAVKDHAADYADPNKVLVFGPGFKIVTCERPGGHQRSGLTVRVVDDEPTPHKWTEQDERQFAELKTLLVGDAPDWVPLDEPTPGPTFVSTGRLQPMPFESPDESAPHVVTATEGK